jgi:very-short-patch-repair endonuclease
MKWSRLLADHRLSPHYFWHQSQPILLFEWLVLVDFVCFEKELIIELDGGQHGKIEIIKSDKIRDDFLKYQGFKILRFWNEEVYKNCFEVLDFIYFQLKR